MTIRRKAAIQTAVLAVILTLIRAGCQEMVCGTCAAGRAYIGLTDAKGITSGMLAGMIVLFGVLSLTKEQKRHIHCFLSLSRHKTI